MGWISILFPLIAITRGFITDTIRSAAMEKGYTAFGSTTMQKNPICVFITSSKFMRISYAVAKVVAFVLLIAAKIPALTLSAHDTINAIAVVLAWIAIIFCVVRAIPVVAESGKLFN